MLYFICKGSTELYGTGNKRKIQNENICLRRESNKRPLPFQPDTLDSFATGTDVLLRLKRFQNPAMDNNIHLHLIMVLCIHA